MAGRRHIRKALVPLGLALALLAVLRIRTRPDAWEYAEGRDPGDARDVPGEALPPAASRRRPFVRLALAATFTTVFFAGASFTAGAGDVAVKLLEDDAAATAELAEITAAAAEVVSAEASAPVEEAPVEEAPVEEAAVEEAAVEDAPVEVEPEPVVEVASAPEAEAADAAVSAPEAPAPASVTAPAPSAPVPAVAEPAVAPAVSQPGAAPAARPAPAVPTAKWVVKRAAERPARAPEVEHDGHGAYGEPTIWLNRALPDPTPASARLARSFARDLVQVSRRHGADWAAVLGVLRAQGERGAVPATPAELATLARRLAADPWRGALAISGRTAFADRAVALADLYRSVGVEALVTGFAAAKERLARNLLEREGVLLYPGGRADIEAGRIDVRLLVLVGYLAERHGSVTVSSLFSGHRKYARPGVISAHTYGHAVDISAVGGTPVAGNQQPGGTTEAAVRSVLLLPAELQPQQVISLLGLGGASFPLRDHGDHIHIGY